MKNEKINKFPQSNNVINQVEDMACLFTDGIDLMKDEIILNF